MIKKTLKKVYCNLKKIDVKIKLNSILNQKDENSNIYLIGSPLHGNIGDHAISIAEVELLKKANKTIIEVPGEYFKLSSKQVIDNVRKNDIIVITGGGFIGTLWMNEEEMIRKVITSFPKNKIIIMPQTIFFENSEFGNAELKKSKSIYEAHNNLHMFLREKKSYDFCVGNFAKVKQIELVPDIVTYLNYTEPRITREGVLFCLRKDKEKVIDDACLNKLKENLIKENITIKDTTTVIKKNIALNSRNKIFSDKLKEFKSSKIVITDRLHGMIFCAITATPCIAFNNLSGKVIGVYDWIKNLNYIKVMSNNDSMKYDFIEENLKNNIEYYYDNKKIIQYFDKILEIIK